MLIMGIDPGSRKAGYGIIELEKRSMRYVASGVMRYDNVKEFVDRLGHIYSSCLEIVSDYRPAEIAVESLIYVKSVTALAKLAQARGAMIAAFMKTHQQRVFEYSPNLVKSAVTGHGHSAKENVDKALGILFGPVQFKTHDESDALAIAVCHALMRNQKPILRGSGRSLRSIFKDQL